MKTDRRRARGPPSRTGCRRDRLATEADDGLLTASEVAQLDLNADWVILSACNTAASDGTPGAEGLSGLAKAFFYAGARALLVSHWPVASDAAVKLTTGLFKEAAAHPEIGRAEALRRSMLALMEDGGNRHFAHPMFWARSWWSARAVNWPPEIEFNCGLSTPKQSAPYATVLRPGGKGNGPEVTR